MGNHLLTSNQQQQAQNHQSTSPSNSLTGSSSNDPAATSSGISNTAPQQNFSGDLGGSLTVNQLFQHNAKKNNYFEKTDITRLDLRGRNLVTIPEAITRLTALQWLNLPNNHILELPDYLLKMTSLITLRLLGNDISNLPLGLANLSNLTSLDLSKNKIRIVENHIGDLKAIVELNFHWNRIKEVTPQINNLLNLKYLNFSLNFLKSMPDISNLPGLEILDLAHNRLVDIPTCKNITSLNLAGNQIKHIDGKILQGMVFLRQLDLQCNELLSLPEEICALSNLKYLRLRSNQLMELPPTIYQISVLEELELSQNNLLTLPTQGISQLVNLQHLYLYYNKLIKLPDDLCNMVNLRNLGLSYNELQTFPVNFGSFPHLTSLICTNNRITDIPEEVFIRMTSLHEVVLNNNELKKIPDSIVSLVQLRCLEVSMNRLKVIPSFDPITQLHLSSLNFSCNRLKVIPLHICQLPHLTSLNLFGNSIAKIPPELSQLPLRRLYLSYNLLTADRSTPTLPPEFAQLSSTLQVLHLSGNSILEIPSEIWKLTQLMELCLSNNSIMEISTGISSLVSLKSLLMNCNRIRTISPAISYCTNITELDLSHNELSELPEEINMLKNLVDLDISGNVICSFPESFEIHCVSLHQIKMSYNRFVRLPKWDKIDRVDKKKVFINFNCNPCYYEIYKEDEETRKLLKKKEREEKKLLKARKKPTKRGKLGEDSEEDREVSSTSSGAQMSNIADVSAELGSGSGTTANTPISSDSLNGNPSPVQTNIQVTPAEANNKPATGGDIAKANSKKDNQKKEKISDIDYIISTMKKQNRKERKDSTLFCEPLIYREKLGWAEMRGGRPDMQDTISIYTNFRNSSARTLLCSFDGHSGELSAEYAANSIGHIIASNLKDKEKSLKKRNKPREELKEEDFIQVFTKSFWDIHNSIREQKIDDGTAALVVLVEEDRKRLIVANAGDQRAVVAKGELAVPITTDHKPDEPGERFRVYSEGGFVNEQKRVNGILSLSRSLGDTDLQPYVTYVPDVFFVDLSSGEYRFLIIACDGLWDVVSNQKAVEIVVKYSMDPVRSAAALRDYAHLLGSSDNISVIVYKLDFDRRESNIMVPPSSSTTTSSSSEAIELEKDNIHISPDLPGPEPPLVNLTSNPNV